MKILRVFSSLDPIGGGPAEAARTIDAGLIQMGHEVEVACLDQPGKGFLSSYPAKTHALGPYFSGYGYSARLIPWLRANRRRFDAVIVDGLWQFQGRATWRALAGTDTPYFLFPHGMLDLAFDPKYSLKRLKKWIYWTLVERKIARDARAVLFTSEEERRVSGQAFWLYRAHETIVSLGTRRPSDEVRLGKQFILDHPELKGKRIALFLGRIHPVKGCDLLIEAFAKVALLDDRLHLVIAGPDETNWQKTLARRAIRLGVEDRISWTGMLQGDEKWGAINAAEVCCLPSHHENFGMVVVESLSCGTPVLISDKVNIWRDVCADGAGIVRPDTVDGTTSALMHWLAMSEENLAEMRTAAMSCFEARFRIEKVVENLVEVIRSAISRK